MNFLFVTLVTKLKLLFYIMSFYISVKIDYEPDSYGSNEGKAPEVFVSGDLRRVIEDSFPGCRCLLDIKRYLVPEDDNYSSYIDLSPLLRNSRTLLGAFTKISYYKMRGLPIEKEYNFDITTIAIIEVDINDGICIKKLLDGIVHPDVYSDNLHLSREERVKCLKYP